MLSRFQRLRTRLAIQVNGDEVVRRRGRGRLLMAIAVRDSAGKRYTESQRLDLTEPRYSPAQSIAEAAWIETVFVLPGDYEITFAVADLTTGEHNLARRKLHVAPLAGDPLPGAWRDLPAVEFVESYDPPDGWFLPEITTRLALPVETRRRVRVDIVMNAAISETSRRAQRHTEQSKTLLIPALKTLSQMDVRNGMLRLAVMDVARRREIFTQDSGPLDWRKLKAALAQDDPRTIDASALKERGQDAQFFVHHIAKRIAGDDGALHVLIVLSPPMAFPGETDRSPIEPPEGSDCRVFYIKYETLTTEALVIGPPASPPSSRQYVGLPADVRQASRIATHVMQEDQLEQTLKPLRPKVFDVWTPLEFRKALGAIVREISAN